MLEIKHVEVYGLERAVNCISNSYTTGEINTSSPFSLLPLDKAMKKLDVASNLGSNTDPHQSHDAYLKGVIVTFDIKYPLYWSPEFQRYHFAEIIMSQSTMHSLKRMIENADAYDPFNKYVLPETKELIKRLTEEYEKETDKDKKYEAFMRLRSNLCCGLEMWATVTTNYLQLKTIWIQRHNHKLKEDWGAFCKMIEELPKFKELCLNKLIKNN